MNVSIIPPLYFEWLKHHDGFPLVIFYLPESISRAGLFVCYLALHLLFLFDFNGENKTVKTASKHTSQNQTVNQIQYFHIIKCTSFSASTLIFLLHNNLFSDLWICCCFFNCFVVWHCNWLQASYNLQNEFPWMLRYTLPLLHWISASLTLTFAYISFLLPH